MSVHRPWGSVALVFAAVLVLGSCGINTDESPRDVGAPVRAASGSDNGQTGITATTTSVIYLVGHDDTGRFVLRPTARDVTETIDNALQALFNGPTQRELHDDLRSAIPSSTRLISATPNNDVVTIDVSDRLADLTGSTLVDAVGQIVLTATDVTGVRGVVITVHSVMHPWPVADGRITTDPLTRDDYAALLPSTGGRGTDPTVAPTGPAGPSTTIVAASPPAVTSPTAAPPVTPAPDTADVSSTPTDAAPGPPAS